MKSTTAKQGLVWGGVLILVGVLLLVETFTDLSAWLWVALLAAGGLAAFLLYLTDRSDWTLLIPTYVLWAVALMLALITLNVLRDDAVAGYVLAAIALPFLAVYLRDRAQWWALIPAYVLLAIGLMIVLLGLGVLDDLLVPAYVLLAIALPFFLVFALDTKLWWALIPGGVLALIGLGFLLAEAAVQYVVPALLLIAGAWILVRVLTRREPADKVRPADEGRPADEAPEPSGPESDVPGEEQGE